MTRRRNVQHGQERRRPASALLPAGIIVVSIPVLIVLLAEVLKAVI